MTEIYYCGGCGPSASEGPCCRNAERMTLDEFRVSVARATSFPMPLQRHNSCAWRELWREVTGELWVVDVAAYRRDLEVWIDEIWPEVQRVPAPTTCPARVQGPWLRTRGTPNVTPTPCGEPATELVADYITWQSLRKGTPLQDERVFHSRCGDHLFAYGAFEHHVATWDSERVWVRVTPTDVGFAAEDGR